jgi:hypothetical protein
LDCVWKKIYFSLHLVEMDINPSKYCRSDRIRTLIRIPILNTSKYPYIFYTGKVIRTLNTRCPPALVILLIVAYWQPSHISRILIINNRLFNMKPH